MSDKRSNANYAVVTTSDLANPHIKLWRAAQDATRSGLDVRVDYALFFFKQAGNYMPVDFHWAEISLTVKNCS